MVACLGSSFPELLAAGGLHFVHLHLDMYTRMLAAPGLHVSQQSAGSAVLRLRREGEGSACAGLGWVMAGAVRGVAHVFFNCGVVIEALGREQGHDGVEEVRRGCRKCRLRGWQRGDSRRWAEARRGKQGRSRGRVAAEGQAVGAG